MQKTDSNLIALFLLTLALSLFVLAVIPLVGKSAPNVQPTQTKDSFSQVTLLSATTTSATSTDQAVNGVMNISGAKKVDLYFSRAYNGGNAGSSTFRVQVSNDQNTWYDWNKLVQNVASTTDGTTVGSITISAATSTVVAGMDLRYDAFQYLRCIVVEATDGAHTCAASAEF